MHTIPGAHGPIGRERPRHLHASGGRVRHVSRTPGAVHPPDEVVGAALLDARATARAVEGSAVVCLVAGLTYDTRTCQAEWPSVMRNDGIQANLAA